MRTASTIWSANAAPTMRQLIARRFFDTKFGPNYDLREPLDLAIFNFIMQFDRYYLAAEILEPETFFGAYEKNAPGR